MWRRRESRFGRRGLLALVLVTGIWSWWILGRNDQWLPALRWTILAVTVVAIVPMVLASTAQHRRRVALAAMAIGLAAALAGPAAYAVATISQPHQGGGPSVGPPDADGGSFGGWGQTQDDPQLDALLRATSSTWSAATTGSSAAAALELSTDTSVMAIGGFSGRDPVPTLDEFKQDVAQHRVGYYVVRKGRGGAFGGHGHSDITDWVSATFTPINTGQATVYDLSRPK